MSLNSTILNVVLTGGETNSFGAVTGVSIGCTHQSISASAPLVNGTSLVASQANHIQKITGSATTGGVTIDLTSVAGGLDGLSRDWSHGNSNGAIKGIIVENVDSTHVITVTLPGSNGWTGFSGEATAYAHPIGPGGILVVYTPLTGMAVSSTNKSFILTSDAGTPIYRITVVGVGL